MSKLFRNFFSSSNRKLDINAFNQHLRNYIINVVALKLNKKMNFFLDNELFVFVLYIFFDYSFYELSELFSSFKFLRR